MATGTQTGKVSGEQRAKLLTTIGERLLAVQEESLRSQTALIAAAKAILASDEGAGSHGALADHVEEMFAYQSPFNECKQFLTQAAADAKVGNNLGSAKQFADYVNCLRRPQKFQPF